MKFNIERQRYRRFERSQRIDQPEVQNQASHSAGTTQQNALHEELPDQSHTCCAECQPDRQLFTPSDSAREQKISDIGTGNQKNQTNNCQQNLGDGFKQIAKDRSSIAGCIKRDSKVGVCFRIVLRETAGNNVHGGLRLTQSNALF